jgi:hypothetical protein
MSGQAKTENRIRAAAEKRREADRARDQATEELRLHLREGRRGGLPVTEMAALAGLSRQAIYDLLQPVDR